MNEIVAGANETVPTCVETANGRDDHLWEAHRTPKPEFGPVNRITLACNPYTYV